MTVGDNRQCEVDGYQYDYDAWGNTIQRTTQDEEQYFEYDNDNRLIRAQVYRQHQQVSDSHYHYDPLGRRIRKAVTYHDPQTATAHTKSTDFLWQGLRLLSETQHQPEQPTTTRLYCYEQNSYAPLARIDTTKDGLNTPEVYYLHTDVTGTPKEVTDTAGQIVWQADYNAWGEIDLYRIHQIDQPLRFQGHDETGLYYTTFRYYDPHAGRFTTQDPIGLAGGWNLYQYAPNPTGWVDPWGLSCSSDAAKLRENMVSGGGEHAPDFKNAAHHIIMSNSKDFRMVKLREILEKFGLHHNEHYNGVYLPTSSAVKEAAGTILPAHSKIHTNIYKQNVYDKLIKAETPETFLAELTEIKSLIKQGLFPF